MSPRRLTVQLGLTVLSFLVPAVWTGCSRLIHHGTLPTAVAPASDRPAVSAGADPALTACVPGTARDAPVQEACDVLKLVQDLGSSP